MHPHGHIVLSCLGNWSCTSVICRKVVGIVSPRGTHMLRYMGMCRTNGSHFHKISPNLGPIFYKSIRTLWFISVTEPKFWGVCYRHANTQYLWKIGLFQEKSLKMGTFFCQNGPLKWVGVLKLERHTLVQTKSEYPVSATLLRLKIDHIIHTIISLRLFYVKKILKDK